MQWADGKRWERKQSHRKLARQRSTASRDRRLAKSQDHISGLASPPPIGDTTLTTVYANDTFLGFDSTNNLSPVSPSSSSGQVLLAALTLDASITSVGESFTVSLVPSSGNGSSSAGTGTYFNVVDSSFNELSAVPFTSTSGTVTITANGAIPEPASIISGLTTILILACWHGRRRFVF